MKNNRDFKDGDYVRHFKRELLDTNDTSMRYFYQIISKGLDTESNTEKIIYQSLEDGQYYIRPLDEFYSKVDKEKYPNIKQEYRFEKITINFIDIS